MTDQELLQAMSGMIDSKIQPIFHTISTMQENMVTLQGNMVTLQGNMVTMQGNIAEMQGSISEMQGNISEMQENMVTKADLHDLKMELYNEIIIVEKQVERLSANQSKIDTLYLKEDTSTIILKKVDELEDRVTVLERKIS